MMPTYMRDTIRFLRLSRHVGALNWGARRTLPMIFTLTMMLLFLLGVTLMQPLADLGTREYAPPNVHLSIQPGLPALSPGFDPGYAVLVTPEEADILVNLGLDGEGGLVMAVDMLKDIPPSQPTIEARDMSGYIASLRGNNSRFWMQAGAIQSGNSAIADIRRKKLIETGVPGWMMKPMTMTIDGTIVDMDIVGRLTRAVTDETVSAAFDWGLAVRLVWSNLFICGAAMYFISQNRSSGHLESLFVTGAGRAHDVVGTLMALLGCLVPATIIVGGLAGLSLVLLRLSPWSAPWIVASELLPISLAVAAMAATMIPIVTVAMETHENPDRGTLRSLYVLGATGAVLSLPLWAAKMLASADWLAAISPLFAGDSLVMSAAGWIADVSAWLPMSGIMLAASGNETPPGATMVSVVLTTIIAAYSWRMLFTKLDRTHMVAPY